MTFNIVLQRKANNFKRRAGVLLDEGRVASGPTQAKAGFVWIEQQTGPNSYQKPVQILNSTAINRVGAHVLIGRNQDGDPIVVGINALREVQRGTDPAGSQQNSQLRWVPKGLLQEFLPIAIGTTEIGVSDGFLPNGDYFPGVQTSSLDTLISGLSSDEHQLAAVYCKLDGSLESPASTAKSALDPLTGADLAEAAAGASPGAVPVIAVQLTAGQTEIGPDSFWADLRILMAAPLAYSEADVSSPPTAAELTSTFGSPADIGRMIGVVNDAGGGSSEYLVWNDGTAWFYVAGTAAS